MYPTPRLQRGSFVRTQVRELRRFVDVSLVAENGEHGNLFMILWKYLRLSLLAFSHVFDRDISIVHAHYIFPTGLIGLTMKFIRGWKLVVTAHRGDVLDMPRRSRIHFFLTRFVLRHCDAVIAVSEELERILVSDFNVAPALISVIDMGYDSQLFNSGDRLSSRESLGLSNENVIASTVGYDFERKGGADILHAICEAGKGEFENLRFHFISKNVGKQYAAYINESGCSRNIRFLGPLPSEEVANWLRASDIYILASLSEGLPISLLEAMASGCAAIATNVGGVPAVLKDSVNGILIHPNDVLALRRSLKLLLDDVLLRNRLAEEGVKSVASFDAATKASQVYGVYQKISSSKTRS
jgi:glycosyltransferase involved in cell wall biosynthesis